MKTFITILIIIYIYSLFGDVTALGYYKGCEWYRYFTYTFAHANLIHLAINCGVITLIEWKIRPFRNITKYSIFIFCTVVSGYLSACDTITIGASGLAMSMSGFLVSLLSLNDIRKNMIIISLSFIFTYFFVDNINTLVHAYAFYMSFILGLVSRKFGWI